MGNKYLTKSILRLCKQPRSFGFITKSLNGCDPIQTMSILNALENEGKLIQQNDMWRINDTDDLKNSLFELPIDGRLYLQKYMGYFDFLKTPHPLDFEWRNSSLSLGRLLNKLSSLVEAEDKLLFLGMPTLFAKAIERDIPNPIKLIERNRPIIEGLQKINIDSERFKIMDADIFKINPTSVGEHFGVMMDPPWYSTHFFQFLWLAATCVSIGGFVAISLPPINTRPDIMSERLKWFSFCKDLGLTIEFLQPQQLQYAMPFFEFNAFRAAGIKDILPFWRKGDLAIFRKVGEVQIARPVDSENMSEWVEREYNSTRIRIKVTNKLEDDSNENVTIENIVKGDILPTISSRDSRRPQANIWTSGNRIFKTNNPAKLLLIIDRILQRKKLSEDESHILIFLNTTSEFESNEYKEYLDWIYYEMERQTD